MAVSYPRLKCLGALWGAQEHLCLQERISEESLEKTQLFEKMQRERSTGRKCGHFGYMHRLKASVCDS